MANEVAIARFRILRSNVKIAIGMVFLFIQACGLMRCKATP